MSLSAQVFSAADYFEGGGNRVTLAHNLTIGPEVVERTVRHAEFVVRCTECFSTAGCSHVGRRVV